MFSPAPKPICVLTFLFALFLQFSCSKDSDLLADYVTQDDKNAQSAIFDIKVFAKINEPVVIDPINEGTNAVITAISEPSIGTAAVNPDNTITYTPNPNTTGTDAFSINSDITNTNNTVTSSTTEINVTIVDAKGPLSGANIYYVTPDGKSTNTGSTEASSWSIQKAFSSAKAGDYVYIKAGNYGAINLVVTNSGTLGNPIQFIGYKDVPWDIKSINGSTVSYLDYKNYGNNLNENTMPLLQGTRINNIGIGRAIESTKNFIQIENMMIKYYEIGIYNKGNNNVFKNIVNADLGDFNPDHSYNPNYPTGGGTKNLADNLTGNGIWTTGGSNNLLINCISINCGARGLALVNESNSEVNYCKVYSNNNINPTDYYILLYNSHNNKLNDCYVERVGNLNHPGHGFALKIKSSYNTYVNCNSKNTGIELNGDVNNNSFNGCHVQGTGTGYSGGIEVTNNSHDNEFIACSNDGGEGIVFADWVESDGDNGINTAAYNNKFVSCTISNVMPIHGGFINFYWNQQSGRLTSYARNNSFENCIFSGADYFFSVDRANSANIFNNCTVKNVASLRYSKYNINETLELDAIFTNTTINNVGFSLPGN